MAIYKDKDTWRFRKQWTDKQGITHKLAGTPLINTKKAAELAEHKAIEQEENPTHVATEAPKLPTFAKFAETFMATYGKNNNKPSELASKASILKTHLLPFLGELPIDQISTSQVEHLKAGLLAETAPSYWVSVNNHKWRGLSAKRVNNVLHVLSKMLKYAQELELLDKVPKCKTLKVPPQAYEFFTGEELNKLVASSAVEPDWLAAILLASDAGLRLGELRALRWQDVNFKASTVRVMVSDWQDDVGAPKSGKDRVVPLTLRLAKALKAIQHLRSKLVLARWDGGGAYTDTSMHAAIKRQLKRAGLPIVGTTGRKRMWHALRHTFCSNLAQAGAPAKAIQELAGHQSIAVTNKYMHATPATLAAAMALLEQA